jgi:WS/DGAT/MGAT family acyltransferase
MKQLTGLDSTFLFLETAQMPMHVGALHLLEMPPGYRGNWANDLRKHLASRLHLTPPLRRKLAWMPLNLANPAWVHAEPDMGYHVQTLKIGKVAKGSNGLREMEVLVGKLHSQLLDRTRPLWRFFVVEGLPNTPEGNKVMGFYSQLHHAAVDGQAAVALAQIILDLTPEPRAIAPGEKRPRKANLSMADMLSGIVVNQIEQYRKLARALPSAVGTLSSVLSDTAVKTAGGMIQGDPTVSNVSLAPRTAFNATLTAPRAFATASIPMADIKAVGKGLGATVNDVVLAVTSGALRRYLKAHRALPSKSLIAAVPISLREKGDTSASNQASMTLVSLGTHIAQPAKRMAHIQEATGAMKNLVSNVKSLMPTDFPTLGVPWLMSGAAKLYGKTRAADRIPQMANLVISNVPGPATALYLAGGKMLCNYPTSIVVHGVGLNLTVQSYNGRMDFGFMAAADAMPDVRALADAVDEAWAEVQALAVSPKRRAVEAAPQKGRASPQTRKPSAAKKTSIRASSTTSRR